MKSYIKKNLRFFSTKFSNWKNIKEHNKVMMIARQRVLATICIASFAYCVIGFRLVNVMLIKSKNCPDGICYHKEKMRRNILDRNGEILATQLVTASVYANPKVVIDYKDAAKKLKTVFKDLNEDELIKKLSSDKGFVWIIRHICPKDQSRVNNLGIPGIYLQSDQKRVYPHGSLVSHVLGCCNIDGQGIMGIENHFDQLLIGGKEDLSISIDIRIQHVVFDELKKGIEKFQAIGGNAMIMDIKTGEILAMVSIPDFDPNLYNTPDQSAFNRNTLGVYEPGSVFKAINMAIALESGVANVNTIFDASEPIKIGKFVITDFKGKNRPLTMLEAFMYSSNIACIKIAQKFGNKIQKEFFKKFGILDPIKLEIPENGYPIIPQDKDWKEVSTMTMSYGYGISVSPIQTFSTITGFINDGCKAKPTLIAIPKYLREKIINQNRKNIIISEKTSMQIRKMMRAVVTDGTAKKAYVEGYQVFGKTGTAYQAKDGNYGKVKQRTTTFIGAFPFDNPQFSYCVMLDDPKGLKETHGYATAGWNCAEIAGKTIERIAPILGVKPMPENKDLWQEQDFAVIKTKASDTD